MSHWMDSEDRAEMYESDRRLKKRNPVRWAQYSREHNIEDD